MILRCIHEPRCQFVLKELNWSRVWNPSFPATVHLSKRLNWFCCPKTLDDKTKTKNPTSFPILTSKHHSITGAKTFANQHALVPVKTCRLFLLFEWTPAGTFDAGLAQRAFIQWITSESHLFSFIRSANHISYVSHKHRSNTRG